MNANWRTRVLPALRLGCALGLMLWLLQRLRLQDLAVLTPAAWQPGWLGLAVLLGGLSVLAWAARWGCFLRVYCLRVRFAERLKLTFYADFFNLYFLGPLGADGVRLLLLERALPGRRGAILGSLLLDHIGGLFGGVLIHAGFRHQALTPAGVLAAADRLLPLLAGATFLGLGVIMEPRLQALLLRLPGLRGLAQRCAPVFAGHFRHLWLLAGFAASWAGTACSYAAYWAAARAVAADVTLVQILGTLPLVDFAASLPVTVSGLGVRENLLVEWLGAASATGPARALAVSLLGFAAIGLWGGLGGLGWLLRRRAPAAVQTTA